MEDSDPCQRSFQNLYQIKMINNYNTLGLGIEYVNVRDRTGCSLLIADGVGSHPGVTNLFHLLCAADQEYPQIAQCRQFEMTMHATYA